MTDDNLGQAARPICHVSSVICHFWLIEVKFQSSATETRRPETILPLCLRVSVAKSHELLLCLLRARDHPLALGSRASAPRTLTNGTSACWHEAQGSSTAGLSLAYSIASCTELFLKIRRVVRFRSAVWKSHCGGWMRFWMIFTLRAGCRRTRTCKKNCPLHSEKPATIFLPGWNPPAAPPFWNCFARFAPSRL